MSSYDIGEVDETFATLSELLHAPTRDGGMKRSRGEKPPWRIDPGHEAAMYRHLGRWVDGEKHDPDSGAHPLIHMAWRALAIAYQEEQDDYREST